MTRIGDPDRVALIDAHLSPGDGDPDRLAMLADRRQVLDAHLARNL